MNTVISQESSIKFVHIDDVKLIRSKSADFSSFLSDTKMIENFIKTSKLVKFSGESEPSWEESIGIPSSTYKVRDEHKLSERSKNHHRRNWSVVRGGGSLPEHESFCIKFPGGYGSGCHIGCDKNQDYTHAAILPGGEVLSILCDGHGSNTAIDLIRSIPEDSWQKIGKAKNPMIALEKWIQDTGVDTLTPDSGACVIIVRASKKHLKYWSVGDCSAFIWKTTKNNVSGLIHQSQHHFAEEPLESLRLKRHPGAGTTPERSMRPVQRTIFQGIKKNIPHICFGVENIGTFDYGRVLLQPTRACGHAPSGKQSVTGGEDSIKEWGIDIEPDTTYKIVMYSDGVGDLVHPSQREYLPSQQNAIELVNKAMAEWASPMFVSGPCRMSNCKRESCSKGGDHGKISGGMSADDISVVMLTVGK